MSVQGEKLKAIADAIREKKGTTDLIAANDFASEILSIESGIEPSGTIDITENGTYDVTEYASANVNVSGGAGGEYNIEVTLNEDGTQNLIISDAGESGGSGFTKLPQLMAGTLTELTAEDMEGVTNMRYHSIYNQKNLTSITIPETLEDYESGAIENCPNVVEINYNAPNIAEASQTYTMFNTIGNNAEGITLNIGDNVQCIPEYFMYQNYFSDSKLINVKTINIGKGLKKFTRDVSYARSNAFTQLKNLTEVNFNAIACEDIGYYDAQPFAGSAGETSGFVVNIGEDVERIPANLFYSSKFLTKVKFLGNKVTTIGDSAFAGRSGEGASLFDFRNCTQVPTLPTSYSIDNASGCQIVVPDALYDEWTTATNWSALPTDTATTGYVVWVKASEYVEV